MIELPESYVLAEQINENLVGKTIKKAEANTFSHGFAWYSGDPAEYAKKLKGQTIISANPGTVFTTEGHTEIVLNDWFLLFTTALKYHFSAETLPKKHQFLAEFTDGTFLSSTVQMYGRLGCEPIGSEKWNNGGNALFFSDDFDEQYFEKLVATINPKESVKALLATKQRIPGLGNGVLQDILFNCEIHPKTRLSSLKDSDIQNLFNSMKNTMTNMRDKGGRDTETLLFGEKGEYKTIFSNKAMSKDCPNCGGQKEREAFLGGNIYFCPVCQKLEKVIG